MYGGSMLGESINQSFPKRGVYLEGSNFQGTNKNITRVVPLPQRGLPLAPFHQSVNGVVFEGLKPVLYLLKGMAMLPISPTEPKVFKVKPLPMLYCIFIYLLFVGYVAYIKWDKVEMISSAEGKFEEAVIDYLFSVYLFPIVLVPINWYESFKLANVLNDWGKFEDVYKKITDKTLPLFVGNKPLLVAISLPVISIGSMVVTHMTMAHFKVLQVTNLFNSIQCYLLFICR